MPPDLLLSVCVRVRDNQQRQLFHPPPTQQARSGVAHATDPLFSQSADDWLLRM